MSKRVLRLGSKRKPKGSDKAVLLRAKLRAKVKLIHAFIPIGSGAAGEELKRDVEHLTGSRCSQQEGLPGHHG
jgi:hypothetical protein